MFGQSFSKTLHPALERETFPYFLEKKAMFLGLFVDIS